MKKINSRLTTLASAVGIATIGLGSSALAQAAPVAAGTTISNQASASYTITIDGKDTPSTVKSNRVEVTVKPTGSFTLQENRNIEVGSGKTATFTHYLKNTGNTAGTFTLSAENLNNDDNFDYPDLKIYKVGAGNQETEVKGSVTLQPNETLELRVKGTVPSSAANENTGKIKLTASVTETNVFTNDVASNTDTGTVKQGIINLTKTASVINTKRGQEIIYTITINNSGSADVDNVIVADVIPEGVTYVANSAHLGSETGEILTDVADSDDFKTTTSNGETQLNLVIGKLNENATQKLVFKVTVNDDANVGDITNVAKYGIDGDGDKELDSGEEKTPANDEDSKKATVTVVGDYLGTINDSATDKYADADATSDENKDDKVVKDLVTKEEGEAKVVEFTTWVHNTGDYEESYTLTKPENLPEGVKSVEFFNADGTPLVGNKVADLAKDTTKEVLVKVTLKDDAEATTDDIITNVTLTPENNSKTDTVKLVIDQLKVNSKDVDITSKDKGDENANNQANDPADNYIVGDNNTALIPVTVHNEGTTSDSYTFTNLTDDLPEGSTVKIYENTNTDDAPVKGDEVTASITLDANTNKKFVVEVTLPEDAPSDTTKTIGTKVTSTSNPDVNNTIYNTVSTQKVRKLTLKKDESGSIAPQGEIVYTHTLGNAGNVTESATGSTLTAKIVNNNPEGITTTVYIDSNNDDQLDDNDAEITDGSNLADLIPAGLSPNQSIKVFVKVKGAGNEELLNKEGTTKLTFTPTGTVDSIAAPAAVSVTDTTSVAGLGLYKTQWIGSCDSAASSITYNITPNKQVAPGECIFYQIKADNTTQYAIKDITINDKIPSNTKLNNVPKLVTTGSGALTLTPTTADADAPAVTGTVSTLSNGKTATLTFAVKVND